MSNKHSTLVAPPRRAGRPAVIIIAAPRIALTRAIRLRWDARRRTIIVESWP